ncbi:hypothetical protein JTB14_019001 [Gonioctena quinquepunctata]|nr:hypothetical protein JTB14_019001 [Gonioctena quinquepunctata]
MPKRLKLKQSRERGIERQIAEDEDGVLEPTEEELQKAGMVSTVTGEEMVTGEMEVSEYVKGEGRELKKIDASAGEIETAREWKMTGMEDKELAELADEMGKLTDEAVEESRQRDQVKGQEPAAIQIEVIVTPGRIRSPQNNLQFQAAGGRIPGLKKL